MSREKKITWEYIWDFGWMTSVLYPGRKDLGFQFSEKIRNYKK